MQMNGHDVLQENFIKMGSGQIWSTGYNLPTPTLKDK